MSNSPVLIDGLIDPDKLKARRIRARLTQPGLAEAAGLHPSYITKIEQGRRGGSPETLGRIADVLGIDISELMRDKKAA